MLEGKKTVPGSNSYGAPSVAIVEYVKGAGAEAVFFATERFA